MRIVGTYSPKKNLQSTVVSETRVARSCTGKQDDVFVSRFLEVLEDIFNVDNYMVLGEKIRELCLCFQEEEALQVKKVWMFSGSSYPLLNEILSTMEKSGWTMEIADDECIFPRKVIMDNEEDMTLSQLATYQIGNNNGISTGALSTNNCDMKNLDESGKLNDDTNDDNKVNNKTEEHSSSVDRVT